MLVMSPEVSRNLHSGDQTVASSCPYGSIAKCLVLISYFYFSMFTLGVIIVRFWWVITCCCFCFVCLFLGFSPYVCFLLLHSLSFVCLSHCGILYRGSCSVSLTALLNIFELPLVFSSSACHPRCLSHLSDYDS